MNIKLLIIACLIVIVLFSFLKYLRHNKNGTKENIIVVDVGTYCDYRLMETIISKLRSKYRIIHITNSQEKLDKEDIHIVYSTPQSIIDKPGEIATNLSNSLSDKLVYSSQNPEVVKTTMSYLLKVTYLLKKSILKYSPVKIYAHIGVIQQILLSKCYKHVQTNIIHFAPGFIPNHDIAFTFNNILKNRKYEPFNSGYQDSNYETTYNYVSMLSNLASGNKHIFTKSKLDFLLELDHLLFFGEPLVPKLDYSINNLKIRNMGILMPTIHEHDVVDDYIYEWMNYHVGRIIFISFGSYSSHILEHSPDILDLISSFCVRNNYYALFHNTSNLSLNTNILSYTRFINYNIIVPKCSLVCFTGSLCLQNICFKHKCPMLYVPYIPEQFLWAKIYKMHTQVDYIDINQINTYNANNTSDILKNAIKVKKDFLQKVSNSIKDIEI